MSAAAAYPLGMLMGVCKLREDAAASKVRLAEHRLNEAREQERALRDALVEYARWRLREEDRRYDGIIGTAMNVVGMEDFRGELGGLKQREVEYEGEIIEAGRLIAAREEEVAGARRVYMATIQETRKIEAHRDSWLEEWSREQARLEDVEAEDFTRAPGPVDDEAEGGGGDMDEDMYYD